MPPYNDNTWREIQSQPEAWATTLTGLQSQRGQLTAFLHESRVEQVVFTGCGSTHYAALAAAAAWREIAGADAWGTPASEVWLSPALSFPTSRHTLLVALSRSGATTETIRAVEAFRAADRGVVLTLSCYADAPLAQLGDYNLVLPAGQEQSIAQTRAFSSLYLATLALAVLQVDRDDLLQELARLPQAARSLLSDYGALAHTIARNEKLTRCFFLGSGARYGLACELSLKLKEMSLSESEPFHFLEYRHGPQSMAGPQTLIVGLLSQSNQAHERAVLDEMRELGAQIAAIDPGAQVAPAPLSERISGPLYLPFGQLLAYERAIERGLDPDRPHQLNAVVTLR